MINYTHSDTFKAELVRSYSENRFPGTCHQDSVK